MCIDFFVLCIVPWKAIGLATLLFLAGGGILAIGILIKVGTITSEVKYERDRQQRILKLET